MSATITFAALKLGNIYYRINEDSGTAIVTYDSSAKYQFETIVIPETITYRGKVYRVTGIDKDAFRGYFDNLTSITIPNSVTSIGSNAFYNCSPKKVIVPDIKNWCSIEFGNRYSNPFKGYASLLYSDENTKITKLVIPDGVTSISDYAFSGCNGLTSITIPNSVTSIGNEAFSHCYELTSVTIPNSVVSIGSSAFKYCQRLTSVTIPNSVTTIGSEAFYNTSIKSITIGTDIQTMESNALRGIDKVIWLSNTPPSGYKNAGGTINYVPNNSYSGLSGQKIYPFLSSMFEVDGIKYVPVSPSERTCDAIDCVYNESAENTKISNTVTYKNINMTVQSVGDSICTGNTYIKNLEYSFDGSIGSSAFSGCNGLTSVTIGNSVTSISSSAFSGCSGLTSVTIPNSVINIGSYAFNSCSGLTSVTIPNSVTSIGSYAFSGCSRLTSVTIPNSVTSIGSYAFNSCSGLTSVTIPNSVTSISDYAFDGCSGLTSVTIPNSVTSIGSSAFSGCSGLEKVIVPNIDIKNWCSIVFSSSTDNPLYYAHHLYSDENTEITKLVIPNDVTSIGSSAFSGCSGLTSVTIPNSVTSIGSSAFNGCLGLTSVTIPNSVTSIGSSAFKNCSGLTSVTIPKSVTSISDYAFEGCSGLTSVTIPNSVTSIGSSAFNGCSWLEKVIVPNIDIKNWCSIVFSSSTDNPLYYAHHLYSDENTEITKLVIPNDVTSINSYAFSGCSGLTSVTIGNSVTSIGSSAFSGCSGLTSVTWNALSLQCLRKR